MSIGPRTFAATFLAMAFTIVGALIGAIPGGMIGAFLGGLVVGRARKIPQVASALSWAVGIGAGGLVALLTLARLTEVASYAATALLFIPAGFVGGAAAGLVEGLATRRSLGRTSALLSVAFGLAATIGAGCFRVGLPLVGVGLAAVSFAAVVTYGAMIAE